MTFIGGREGTLCRKVVSAFHKELFLLLHVPDTIAERVKRGRNLVGDTVTSIKEAAPLASYCYLLSHQNLFGEPERQGEISPSVVYLMLS